MRRVSLPYLCIRIGFIAIAHIRSAPYTDSQSSRPCGTIGMICFLQDDRVMIPLCCSFDWLEANIILEPVYFTLSRRI